MVTFIVEYWVQVLFGLICAGMAGLARYFYILYKKEKAHQKSEEQTAFYEGIMKKIDEAVSKAVQDVNQDLDKQGRTDNSLQNQIDSLKEAVETVKAGLLSILGANFRDKCHKFLEPEKIISQLELEHLTTDHKAYNSLGGNSDGDKLFYAVQEKYQTQYKFFSNK